MNILSKYKDFVNELVQPDFSEKNPEFYLNKPKEKEDNSKNLFQKLC